MSGRNAALLLVVLLFADGSTLAAEREPIPEGPGSFQFVDEERPSASPLTVWTFRPRELQPGARVVFVMHGMNRDGRRYRDQWQRHAEAHGFVLVVPELDAEGFSTNAYQRGNVVDERGAPLPPKEWSFGVVERIFDVVRRELVLRTSTYALYGHSAGAQFVHRLVLFLPSSRCSLAIAANAGWYTMPTFDDDFPYGLARSPATEASLRSALGRALVILIGEDDTDPSDPGLRSTARARDQGRNRFERARAFYEAAKMASRRLRVPLRWQYVVVRGVGHSNSAMSDAAVRFLR